MVKRRSSKVEEYRYDVCLSFAGEDRRYVERVAQGLRKAGARVFYDRYEQVEMWGKDLYVSRRHLQLGCAILCNLHVEELCLKSVDKP